jgi:hypothetical protein
MALVLRKMFISLELFLLKYTAKMSERKYTAQWKSTVLSKKVYRFRK